MQVKKPHVHRDVIIAWACGAQIECKYHKTDRWVPLGQVTAPPFHPNFEYRIASPWQKEKDAFDRGERVEYRHGSMWLPVTGKHFFDFDEYEFRIAPIQPAKNFAEQYGTLTLTMGGKTYKLVEDK